MFQDNLEKIRRFIRDPDGSIWDDSLLLGLWNDEQRLFCRQWGYLQIPATIRVPPHSHMTYLYDWENTYTAYTTGHVYQALVYNRQTPIVCCHVWESQEIGLGVGSDTQTGDQYTYPWEAFLISTPADMPPFGWPKDFHQVVLMAYDKEPLEYIPWKLLTCRDTDYKTYHGSPVYYTTRDDFSGEFYLYPRPSPVWNDVEFNTNTPTPEPELTWVSYFDNTYWAISNKYWEGSPQPVGEWNSDENRWDSTTPLAGGGSPNRYIGGVDLAVVGDWATNNTFTALKVSLTTSTAAPSRFRAHAIGSDDLWIGEYMQKDLTENGALSLEFDLTIIAPEINSSFSRFGFELYEEEGNYPAFYITNIEFIS
jgi:hypothetical protein